MNNTTENQVNIEELEVSYTLIQKNLIIHIDKDSRS